MKGLKRDLLTSLVLHLIVIVIFIYGVPSMFEKLPRDDQSITFEIVQISDIANIKNQNQNLKKNIQSKIKKSKKVIKSSSNLKKQLPKIKTELKKKPNKPKEVKEEVTKKTEIKKKTPKPKEEPQKSEPEKKVTTLKQPKKKIEPQKKVTSSKKPKSKNNKKQEDVVDAILRNLEKESQGKKNNSPNRSNLSEDDGTFARGNYDEELLLSVTEKMLIKQQIEDNWTQIAGDLANIKVQITLSLHPNGNVMKADIINVNCPKGREKVCYLVAETTKRAIKKASPIKDLRPNRYDAWKKFDLIFYPGNM